jgi:hypothetical protein
MHIIENRQWGTSVPDDMEQAHTKMCNIPRFLSNFGGIFFAFVLLEMIGISQRFNTFDSN